MVALCGVSGMQLAQSCYGCMLGRGFANCMWIAMEEGWSDRCDPVVGHGMAKAGFRWMKWRYNMYMNTYTTYVSVSVSCSRSGS